MNVEWSRCEAHHPMSPGREFWLATIDQFSARVWYDLDRDRAEWDVTTAQAVLYGGTPENCGTCAWITTAREEAESSLIHCVGGGDIECYLCGGEGVIDGLLLDDSVVYETCGSCKGAGRVKVQ